MDDTLYPKFSRVASRNFRPSLYFSNYKCIMHPLTTASKLCLLGFLARVIQCANGNCVSVDPSRDFPCIPYENIRENDYEGLYYNNYSDYTHPTENEAYRTIIPTNIEVSDTNYYEYDPEHFPSTQISDLDQASYLQQGHLNSQNQNEINYYQQGYEDIRHETIEPKNNIQSSHVYEIPSVTKGDPDTERLYYNYNSVPAESEGFNIIVKKPVMHRRYFRPQRPLARPPFAFPSSPFPGWSGIYSPNPGYLVKQRFQIYRPPPAYAPHRQKSLSSVWQKAFG